MSIFVAMIRSLFFGMAELTSRDKAKLRAMLAKMVKKVIVPMSVTDWIELDLALLESSISECLPSTMFI